MHEHTCQAEIEMWGPHPGCREYMQYPEAVIQCDQPATTRTCLRLCWYPDPTDPTDTGDETEAVYTCDAHRPTPGAYTHILSQEVL